MDLSMKGVFDLYKGILNRVIRIYFIYVAISYYRLVDQGLMNKTNGHNLFSN